MGMSSPAEAKLDARVRPQITAMRARTGYPRLRLVDAAPDAGTPDAGATAAAATGAAATGAAATGAAATGAGARAASRGRGERTPIRLTRRGRIVVGAAVAIGAVAAASLIWFAIVGQAQAASHGGSRVPLRDSVQRVVVSQGESLWAIAVKVDPDADPRAVIPQIVELNSLRGTGIRIGQVLWVPKD